MANIILNTTELFTVKWLVFCYVNFTSIKTKAISFFKSNNNTTLTIFGYHHEDNTHKYLKIGYHTRPLTDHMPDTEDTQTHTHTHTNELF